MDTAHWWIITAQYEVKTPDVVCVMHCDYYDALKQLDLETGKDVRMKMIRQLGLFVLAANSESGSYHTSTSFQFYPDDLQLAQPWKE